MCDQIHTSRRRGRLQPMTLVLMLLAPVVAFAQERTLVFTGPPTPMVAGGDALLVLHVLNLSETPLSWTFPPKITCRLLLPSQETVAASLDLQASTAPNEAQIAPGAFGRRTYRLQLPATAKGRVILEFTSVQASPLVLEAEVPPSTPAEKSEKSGLARMLQQAEPKQEGEEFSPGRFFKEHISGYEPFYFIAGSESPNVKFQVSLKYQVLNNEGALAGRAPVLKGLHIAYTQTSLWDWNKPSAPFLDSSYKPELLFLHERLVGGQKTNWFRLDLQGGLQHESNGRDGDASRSLNIAYVRPTMIFGKDEGLQFTLQPRAWLYVGDMSDNPDLDRYRGYADLRAIVGWQRGLQLSALGRLGDEGDRGSIQLDLTYPMMTLLSGSFSLYLHAQYFTGYGESLLLYNERSSAFRVGFSLYR